MEPTNNTSELQNAGLPLFVFPAINTIIGIFFCAASYTQLASDTVKYIWHFFFQRAGNGNPEKGQICDLRSCKAYEGYFWYLRLGMAANHMVVPPNTHHIVHSSLLCVKIEF